METLFLVEDFGDVLEVLATGLYEVRPGVPPVALPTGGTRPGVPPAPVPDVLCSVQPLEGDKVERLDEGERVDAWRTVFTRYPLQELNVRTGRTADVLMESGVPFEVVEAHPWKNASGIVHAVVRKLER